MSLNDAFSDEPAPPTPSADAPPPPNDEASVPAVVLPPAPESDAAGGSEAEGGGGEDEEPDPSSFNNVVPTEKLKNGLRNAGVRAHIASCPRDREFYIPEIRACAISVLLGRSA